MNSKYPRKLVGVWMDHHSARVIDARSGAERTIVNKFDNRVRERGQTATGYQIGNFRSSNNEAAEHHQQNQDTRSFYKKITESLIPYDEIYLFGPTHARDEFQNFLLDDSHFRDKVIRVESTDYMTTNQQNAQVKKHFKAQL